MLDFLAVLSIPVVILAAVYIHDLRHGLRLSRRRQPKIAAKWAEAIEAVRGGPASAPFSEVRDVRRGASREYGFFRPESES
jgi:hypothetical protein